MNIDTLSALDWTVSMNSEDHKSNMNATADIGLQLTQTEMTITMNSDNIAPLGALVD